METNLNNVLNTTNDSFNNNELEAKNNLLNEDRRGGMSTVGDMPMIKPKLSAFDIPTDNKGYVELSSLDRDVAEPRQAPKTQSEIDDSNKQLQDFFKMLDNSSLGGSITDAYKNASRKSSAQSTSNMLTKKSPLVATNFGSRIGDTYTRLSNGEYISRYDKFIPGVDMEDYEAKRQGWFEKTMNGAQKFGAQTALYLAGSLLTPVADVYNGIQKVLGKENPYTNNNEFMNFMQDMQTQLDYSLPIYLKSSLRDANLFQKAIGDPAGFFAGDVLNGMSFTAAAIIEAAITKKMTGALGALKARNAISNAKYLVKGEKMTMAAEKAVAKKAAGELAENAAKTASTAAKNGEVRMVGQSFTQSPGFSVPRNLFGSAKNATVELDKNIIKAGARGRALSTGTTIWTSSAWESHFEAQSMMREAEQNYFDGYYNKYGHGPTPEEYAEFMKANNAAGNALFAGNMLVVGTANMLLFGRYLKLGSYGKSITGSVGSANPSLFGRAKNAIVDAKNGLVKGAQRGFLGLGTYMEGNTLKAVEQTSGQKAFGFIWNRGKTAFSEGFYEEGIQGWMSNSANNYLDAKYNPESVRKNASLFDVISQGFTDSYGTNQGWMEIGIGGLIGMVMGGWGSGVKSRHKRIEKLVERRNKAAEAVNKANELPLTQANVEGAIKEGIKEEPMHDSEGKPMLDYEGVQRYTSETAAIMAAKRAHAGNMVMASEDAPQFSPSRLAAMHEMLAIDEELGILESDAQNFNNYVDSMSDEDYKSYAGLSSLSTQEEIQQAKDKAKSMFAQSVQDYSTASRTAEALLEGTKYDGNFRGVVSNALFSGLQSRQQMYLLGEKIGTIFGGENMQYALSLMGNISEQTQNDVAEADAIRKEIKNLTVQMQTLSTTRTQGEQKTATEKIQSIQNKIASLEKKALRIEERASAEMSADRLGSQTQRYQEDGTLYLNSPITIQQMRDAHQAITTLENYVATMDKESASGKALMSLLYEYRTALNNVRRSADAMERMADPKFMDQQFGWFTNMLDGISGRWLSKSGNYQYEEYDAKGLQPVNEHGVIGRNGKRRRQFAYANDKAIDKALEDGKISEAEAFSLKAFNHMQDTVAAEREIAGDRERVSDAMREAALSNPEKFIADNYEIIESLAMRVWLGRELSENEKAVYENSYINGQVYQEVASLGENPQAAIDKVIDSLGTQSENREYTIDSIIEFLKTLGVTDIDKLKADIESLSTLKGADYSDALNSTIRNQIAGYFTQDSVVSLDETILAIDSLNGHKMLRYSLRNDPEGLLDLLGAVSDNKWDGYAVPLKNTNLAVVSAPGWAAQNDFKYRIHNMALADFITKAVTDKGKRMMREAGTDTAAIDAAKAKIDSFKQMKDTEITDDNVTGKTGYKITKDYNPNTNETSKGTEEENKSLLHTRYTYYIDGNVVFSCLQGNSNGTFYADDAFVSWMMNECNVLIAVDENQAGMLSNKGNKAYWGIKYISSNGRAYAFHTGTRFGPGGKHMINQAALTSLAIQAVEAKEEGKPMPVLGHRIYMDDDYTTKLYEEYRQAKEEYDNALAGHAAASKANPDLEARRKKAEADLSKAKNDIKDLEQNITSLSQQKEEKKKLLSEAKEQQKAWGIVYNDSQLKADEALKEYNSHKRSKKAKENAESLQKESDANQDAWRKSISKVNALINEIGIIEAKLLKSKDSLTQKNVDLTTIADRSSKIQEEIDNSDLGQSNVDLASAKEKMQIAKDALRDNIVIEMLDKSDDDGKNGNLISVYKSTTSETSKSKGNRVTAKRGIEFRNKVLAAYLAAKTANNTPGATSFEATIEAEQEEAPAEETKGKKRGKKGAEATTDNTQATTEVKEQKVRYKISKDGKGRGDNYITILEDSSDKAVTFPVTWASMGMAATNIETVIDENGMSKPVLSYSAISEEGKRNVKGIGFMEYDEKGNAHPVYKTADGYVVDESKIDTRLMGNKEALTTVPFILVHESNTSRLYAVPVKTGVDSGAMSGYQKQLSQMGYSRSQLDTMSTEILYRVRSDIQNGLIKTNSAYRLDIKTTNENKIKEEILKGQEYLKTSFSSYVMRDGELSSTELKDALKDVGCPYDITKEGLRFTSPKISIEEVSGANNISNGLSANDPSIKNDNNQNQDKTTKIVDGAKQFIENSNAEGMEEARKSMEELAKDDEYKLKNGSDKGLTDAQRSAHLVNIATSLLGVQANKKDGFVTLGDKYVAIEGERGFANFLQERLDSEIDKIAFEEEILNKLGYKVDNDGKVVKEEAKYEKDEDGNDVKVQTAASRLEGRGTNGFYLGALGATILTPVGSVINIIKTIGHETFHAAVKGVKLSENIGMGGMGSNVNDNMNMMLDIFSGIDVDGLNEIFATLYPRVASVYKSMTVGIGEKAAKELLVEEIMAYIVGDTFALGGAAVQEKIKSIQGRDELKNKLNIFATNLSNKYNGKFNEGIAGEGTTQPIGEGRSEVSGGRVASESNGGNEQTNQPGAYETNGGIRESGENTTVEQTGNETTSASNEDTVKPKNYRKCTLEDALTLDEEQAKQVRTIDAEGISVTTRIDRNLKKRFPNLDTFNGNVIIDLANVDSDLGFVITRDAQFENIPEDGNVVIPKGVTQIGDDAFRDKGLKSVKFQKGYEGEVEDIGSYAFAGNNLTEIEFPASIRHIGNSAFEGNSITELTVLPYMTLGYRAFANNILSKVTFLDVEQRLSRNIYSDVFSNNDITSSNIKEVVHTKEELEKAAADIPTLEKNVAENKKTREAIKKHLDELEKQKADLLEKLKSGNGKKKTEKELNEVEGFIETTRSSYNQKQAAYIESLKQLESARNIVSDDADLRTRYYDAINHTSSENNENKETAENNVIYESIRKEISLRGVKNSLFYAPDTNPFTKNYNKINTITEAPSASNTVAAASQPIGSNNVSQNTSGESHKDGVYSVDELSSLSTEDAKGVKKIVNTNQNDRISIYGDFLKRYTGLQEIDGNVSIFLSDVGPDLGFTVNGDAFFVGFPEDGNMVIPKGVTSIGFEAVQNQQLNSVVLPEGLKEIKNSAFEKNNLTEINLPNGIEVIGANAFSGNLLKSIVIPDSVTSLGFESFSGNEIESATLPKGLTTIESGAFRKNKLTSIVIPTNVTSIGRSAFENNKIANITIPSKVTSIGERAFRNNAISGLKIPNDVKTIGKDAFAKNKISSVSLPNGATDVDAEAFDRKVKTYQKKVSPKNVQKPETKSAEDTTDVKQAQETTASQTQQESEQASEEASKKEAPLESVPVYTQDSAKEARSRGFRKTETGEKVSRQEKTNGTNGKTISIKFTSDTQSGVVTGRYKVISADELQPSHMNGSVNVNHFLPEAQPKNRTDDVSIDSAENMSKKMDPSEITGGKIAYFGAPVVNTRGEVIQGNNRSSALKLMYVDSKSTSKDEYKKYLEEHAQDFGLSKEDIDKIDNPILVREIDVTDEEAIALGQKTSQDIESGGAQDIEPSRVAASLDAKEMGSILNTLLFYDSAEGDKTISELIDKNAKRVLDILYRKNIINATQYKSCFKEGGRGLTDKARISLRGIIESVLFANGKQGIATWFDSLPVNAQKAILQTIYRDIAASSTEHKLTPYIQQAIEIYSQVSKDNAFAKAKTYKEAFAAIKQWASQMDAFTSNPSKKYGNMAFAIAASLKVNGLSAERNILNALYDKIQGTGANLFFNAQGVSIDQIANSKNISEDFYEAITEDYGEQNDTEDNNDTTDQTPSTEDKVSEEGKNKKAVKSKPKAKKEAKGKTKAKKEPKTNKKSRTNKIANAIKTVVKGMAEIDSPEGRSLFRSMIIAKLSDKIKTASATMLKEAKAFMIEDDRDSQVEAVQSAMYSASSANRQESLEAGKASFINNLISLTNEKLSRMAEFMFGSEERDRALQRKISGKPIYTMMEKVAGDALGIGAAVGQYGKGVLAKIGEAATIINPTLQADVAMAEAKANVTKKVNSTKPGGPMYSVADVNKLTYEVNGKEVSLSSFANVFQQRIQDFRNPNDANKKINIRTLDDTNMVAEKFISDVKEALNGNGDAIAVLPVATADTNKAYYDSYLYVTDKDGEKHLFDPDNDVNATDLTMKVYNLSLDPERYTASRKAAANAINKQRAEDLNKLLDYFNGNKDYTPTEVALMIDLARKFSYNQYIGPDGNLVTRIINITAENEAPVPVITGDMASFVVGHIRDGVKPKTALMMAASEAAEANASNRGVPSDFTGWKVYAKSDTEEDAIELNRAVSGTGWCTGGTVETARDHRSKGDFHVYFVNGQPSIAIRTIGGRLAESPKGANPGQYMKPEQEKIAEEYLRGNNGVTGGEDFLYDRDIINKFMSGKFTMEDAFSMPEKRRMENGEFGNNAEGGVGLNAWPTSIIVARDKMLSDVEKRHDMGMYFLGEAVAEQNKDKVKSIKNTSIDPISIDDKFTKKYPNVKNVYGLVSVDLSLKRIPFKIEGGVGFHNIPASRDIVIPEGVEEIVDHAFFSCAIASVKIPSSVKKIGNYAFYSNSIKSVEISDGVTEIGTNAFRGNMIKNVVIPNSVKIIDEYAFANNELKTIKLPNGITRIESYAFYENNISSLVIPNSVASIGNYAFCSNSIKSVDIPSSVNHIDKKAFYDNKIEKIDIPENVETIGYMAFKNNHISSINIQEGVKQIGEAAFDNNRITSVNIPSGIYSIDSYAFSNNKIQNINIKEGTKYIGFSAFANNSLTFVTLPNSIEKIINFAFIGNPLNEIHVGENTLIYEDAIPTEAKIVRPSDMQSTDNAGENSVMYSIRSENVEDSIEQSATASDELRSAIAKNDMDAASSVVSESINNPNVNFNNDIVRYSISEKRKEQMRKDMTSKLTEASEDMIENTISEIEKLGEMSKKGGDANIEKIAYFWALKGTVILPEDNYKIQQAIKLVKSHKDNAMNYDSPMKVIDKWSNGVVEEQLINPDTIKEFSNKVDYGNGLVVYEVQDNKEGQQAMRDVMNSHFGKNMSPWCLLYANNEGELDKNSWHYWNEVYTTIPKRVVFYKGKLLAFCASNSGKVTWWDKQDRPHNGIPFISKLNEKSKKMFIEKNPEVDTKGIVGTIEYDEETKTMSENQTDFYRGSIRNGKYEEWYNDGQLQSISNHKNGVNDGLEEVWYENGNIKQRKTYKDGKAEGMYEKWFKNGQLSERYEYKDNEKNGKEEHWYDNGAIWLESNRIKGNRDGDEKSWYPNGQIKEIEHYKNGAQVGEEERWYESGKIKERNYYKDGYVEGTSESFYENGKIKTRIEYKHGSRDGVGEWWNEAGALTERINFKHDKRNGISEKWYPNGLLSEQTYYKKGDKHGESRTWYENGQIKELITYKDRYLSGISEQWFENGQIAIRETKNKYETEGLSEEWYENGQIKERRNFKGGNWNGLSELWYENGQIKEMAVMKDDKYNGAMIRWNKDGILDVLGIRENDNDTNLFIYYNDDGDIVKGISNLGGYKINDIALKKRLTEIKNELKSLSEKADKESKELDAKYKNESQIKSPYNYNSSTNEKKDEEYINAVNDGDMEKAQKMVNDAAEKYMPRSKVRNESGELEEVYHGRTSDFTVFDRKYSNIDGDFGKGFYFTNDYDDVSYNYANEEGPDLKNKIELLAERIKSEQDISYDEAKEIAKKQFITAEPNILSTYINIFNPLYIGKNETYLDYNEEYNEEPEGKLLDFIEALNDNIDKFDHYGDIDFWSILPENMNEDGIKAGDAIKVIKEKLFDSFTDENGDSAVNELIRMAFEDMGYDGIIDSSVSTKFSRMGLSDDVTHYITFKSSQIKMADPVTYDDNGKVIPLSRRFNSENNDIRYSIIGEEGAKALDAADAKNERISALSKAMLMSDENIDAREIKKETGWEMGIDGKWRYEVDDPNFENIDRLIELYDAAKTDDIERMSNKLKQGIGLDKFLDGEDKMFTAYPSLKKTTVKISHELGSSYAAYDSINNEILIKDFSKWGIHGMLIKRALIHEIQHAIQDTEGFAEGGDYDFAMDDFYSFNNPYHQADLDQERVLRWYEDHVRNKGFEEIQKLIDDMGLEEAEDKIRFNKDLIIKYENFKKISKLIEGEFGITNRDFYFRLAGEVEARNAEERMHLTKEERANSLLKDTEDTIRDEQIPLKHGVIMDGFLKARRRNGVYELKFGNGMTYERANYRNGVLEGQKESWFINGKRDQKENYKNGKLDGLSEGWYLNGNKRRNANYKNGKPDGMCETWYNNGSLQTRAIFKNGIINGLYEKRYKNGQVSERYRAKEGKLDGIYEKWYENGQISLRSLYKSNNLEAIEQWENDGTVKLSNAFGKDFDKLEKQMQALSIEAENESKVADEQSERDKNNTAHVMYSINTESLNKEANEGSPVKLIFTDDEVSQIINNFDASEAESVLKTPCKIA